jgi:hypothetical protein
VTDIRHAHVREWARKNGWETTTPSSETLSIAVENGDVLVQVSFFLGSDEAQFEFMGKAPHMVILAVPCDGRNEQLLALLERFRRIVPAELPEFLVALIDDFPDAYDIGSGDVVPLDRDYVHAISEWAR